MDGISLAGDINNKNYDNAYKRIKLITKKAFPFAAI